MRVSRSYVSAMNSSISEFAVSYTRLSLVIWSLICVIAALLVMPVPVRAQSVHLYETSSASAAKERAAIAANYGKLPLSFEANRG